MLLELHIRNMALIEKADIDFAKGFTVLSGETGAGKSILIDSINFALGAKTSKDMIREGEEYAYVELVFRLEQEEKIRQIRDLDFPVADDGILVISRKLSANRSSLKVNDESVSAARLRILSSMLIDIHGQHEHHSLLSTAKHLEIVDSLLPKGALHIKQEFARIYARHQELEQKLQAAEDAYIREREIDILKYEIREIESAKLKPDEEEKLHLAYKRLKSLSELCAALESSLSLLQVRHLDEAAAELAGAGAIDRKVAQWAEKLLDMDAALSELDKEMLNYLEELDYKEENLDKLQKRLDFVHKFTHKYGSDADKLAEILHRKKLRLRELLHFDTDRQRFMEEAEALEKQMHQQSLILREARKQAALHLQEDIIRNLRDLHFLDVQFAVHFEEKDSFLATGADALSFMLSTNPGQPLKPLQDIASGGELSRIMLAFKSVLAQMDEIDTLIFDEIDSGISGRTAQKVAQKLALLGKKHQVLCITHLPQIAAMADENYLIEKSSDGTDTRTDVIKITGEDLVEELARLLGGSEITKAVKDTAREMKELANQYKNG